MSRAFAVLVLATAFVGTFGAGTLLAQEAPAAAALQRLKTGNARFAADKPTQKPADARRRAELAKGQHPFAAILTCADSRVAPELIFDQGLGDVFVLRLAGNVADPAVVGSIEYAVEHLKTPLVVVLGHEKCGAVRAAVEGKPLPGDLGNLIKMVHVGSDLPADGEKAVAAGVRANVGFQMAELTRRSAVVKELVESRRVRIVGGVYSLASGKVDWLEPKANGK